MNLKECRSGRRVIMGPQTAQYRGMEVTLLVPASDDGMYWVRFPYEVTSGYGRCSTDWVVPIAFLVCQAPCARKEAR